MTENEMITARRTSINKIPAILIDLYYDEITLCFIIFLYAWSSSSSSSGRPWKAEVQGC